MKTVDVGREIQALHQKYVTDSGKAEAGFPLSGTRYLNNDDVYPFREAVNNAPRIGRLRNNRKRDDELIAVPRGLLLYLIDQTRYGLYVHDLWIKGELNKLDEEHDGND